VDVNSNVFYSSSFSVRKRKKIENIFIYIISINIISISIISINIIAIITNMNFGIKKNKKIKESNKKLKVSNKLNIDETQLIIIDDFNQQIKFTT